MSLKVHHIAHHYKYYFETAGITFTERPLWTFYSGVYLGVLGSIWEIWGVFREYIGIFLLKINFLPLQPIITSKFPWIWANLRLNWLT